MEYYDYFIAVFGDVTIADAAIVVMALVFMALIYRENMKYFKRKLEAVRMKEKAEEQRNADIKKALDAVEKYPEYRKQSIEIQEELQGEMQEISSQLKEIASRVDKNEIKRIRAEILAFADSLRRGETHTNENFMHIIELHTEYEVLLKYRNEKNGVISEAYDYITRVYQELLAKGELL